LADRYRIERELGHGGMATVYLAEDLRHRRKVAVKVLRPDLAAVLGAERFVQEITTTASLQHPHILALFDSGSAEGFLYYVMPFVDGETLRAKLDRETQLGIDEAIGIATSVADALDYAHRHGVIHRDIKPENILLHDGRPVVADFGIALAVSAAAGGRMTETGLSLGTPHYMSPEQATAEKELTNRSDIYSLASVLYEMLSGSPPHVGSSAQQIIMKIVTDEARPVTELRKLVPPYVGAALAKALEKLPADRFATAHEFAEALHGRGMSLGPGGTAVVSAVAGRAATPGGWRARLRDPVLIGVGLVAITALVAAAWRRKAPEATTSVVRFDIQPFQPGARYVEAAVSPDGNEVLLVQFPSEQSRLLRRSLSSLETRPLDLGGERAAYPTFSPDGREVAWVSLQPGNTFTGRLRVTPLGGGPTRTVADTTIATAFWGDDGYIYFSGPGADSVPAILRVAQEGGPVDTVLATDSMEFYQPRMLPGARTGVAIAQRHGALSEWRLVAFDVRGRSWRELARGGTSVALMRAGYVLYTRGPYLLAARLDSRKLAFAGRPFPVLDGPGGDLGWFAYGGGTLVYLNSSTGGSNEPLLVNRRGAVQRLSGLPARQLFGYPAVSPDGRKIALKVTPAGGNESQADLWVYELPSGPLTRLTTETGVDDDPSWTPDGKRILFDADRKGQHSLWIIPWDGSGSPELVLHHKTNLYRTSWLPGGREFLFDERASGGAADVGLGTLGQPDSSRMLLTGSFSETDPVASPDGRWMAYQSNESGRAEIYVRPLRGEGTRRQVSRQGGSYPRWGWSGRELFFQGGSGDTLMSARLDVQHDAAVQSLETLFPLRQSDVGYDVFPGDSLFVVFGPPEAEGDQSHPAVVVHNFDAVLQATAVGAAKR
jgi:serine/threonine-protein kinase